MKLILIYRTKDNDVMFPVIYSNVQSLKFDLIDAAWEGLTSQLETFPFLGTHLPLDAFFKESPEGNLVLAMPLVLTIDELFKHALYKEIKTNAKHNKGGNGDGGFEKNGT